MTDQTPILDLRDAAALLDELLARRPAYVPELQPAPGQPARAFFHIFARFMQVAIDRLNRAPDKNRLAFLDMMGISLIPASPARAPVVFRPRENAPDARIEAGTRIGASLSEAPQPVVFETEKAIAMAAARLTDVVSLWPARDQFLDHSIELAGGRAFTLFRHGQPVQHELYLSHLTLLACTGNATVEIEIELETAGSTPLRIVWESWDGQTWRGFRAFDGAEPSASSDGTAGLTRSGVVTLRAECGDSVETTINGIESFWIRARLDRPLPPDPARVLAVVDRIRLRTAIDRPNCEVEPDQAFADDDPLDLSTTFFPFGKAPDGESVFYLSSEEVFSKPRAAVTLCFTRVVTPEQEAGEKSKDYEVDVDAAKHLAKDAAIGAAQAVLDAANTVVDVASTASTPAIQQKMKTLQDEIGTFTGMNDTPRLAAAAGEVVKAIQGVVANLNDISSKLNDLLDTQHDAPDIMAALAKIFPSPSASIADILEGLNEQSQITDLTIAVTLAQAKIVSARGHAGQAAGNALAALNALSQLDPLKAAAAGGATATLEPAQLAWEYWDGGAWRALSVSGGAADLTGSGPAKISFTVPDDLGVTDVDGANARWIRARLTKGSYNHLRLVSWFDSDSQITNFLPVIEPRPPALRDLFLGYRYRSPWQYAEECLTRNDFRFEMHGVDARTPGALFPPFRPVADAFPALYLGFDRPLPNDLVSLYFDLEETDAARSPLMWEAWDGAAWRILEVTDGTERLRGPGFISFIHPEVPPRAQAAVVEAAANWILLDSSAEAAPFRRGDQIEIRQENASELRAVKDVQDALLLLETPLLETYSGGRVSLAALPRFGTPRDWVRARSQHDGAPPESRVRGIYLNAVRAVQVRAVSNEMLGSGTGQRSQTFFLIQAPVLPDEHIEVREIEGGRAHVEEPILRDDFRRKGLSQDLIRTVSDPRIGRVTEVWVRWESRPHFFFSGPEDRHYVVERARGRIIFGDGETGRLPTVAANNIRAASYRTTDGAKGNVPAGKITQLLASAPFVESVTNPRAADGGAYDERLAGVQIRGPQVMRHQGRALAARDYEALAQEASPGVALAKALPATAPNLRPAPGWVTVVIVPRSAHPEPQPSRELRRQVYEFLMARMPATVGCVHLTIIGPTYLQVAVRAAVAPRNAGEAGLIKSRVIAALDTFLHPLSGGRDGRGWPFGRDVFLSDAATVLKAVEGIDSVRNLELLLGSVVMGERVPVPADRIVATGALHIELQAPEEASCRCH